MGALRNFRCIAALVAAGCASAAQAQQGVSLTSGFTDFTTWNLYGSATAANYAPGNGFLYSNLQLTAPGIADSAGAGFAPTALALDFNQAFAFDFHFFIAPNGVRGDGLSFTLAGAPGVGNGGSGLGYEGLGHSVAFAVDTFHFDGEPVSPSLQILQGGSVTPLAFTETGIGDAIRDQTAQFRALVSYLPSGNGDDSGTLTGSILHPTQGSFSVSAFVDLSQLRVGDPDPNNPDSTPVFFGFTAANGLATDGHFVTSAIAAPVPEPSTYAMLLAGLVMLGTMARRRQRSASAQH